MPGQRRSGPPPAGDESSANGYRRAAGSEHDPASSLGHDRTASSGNRSRGPALVQTRTAGAFVASVAQIVGRRWPLVLALLLLGVAAGLTMASRMRPRYIARATIVVNPSGSRVLDSVRGINEWESDVLTYAQFNATQRAILASRRIAEHVLDTLELARDPVFLRVDDIPDPDRRAQRLAAIDPVERLGEYVAIKAVLNSRVVEIAVRYPEAETARDIANAFVDAYAAHVDRSQDDTGTQAEANLEQERHAAKRSLHLAEAALDAFKQAHEITSISLSDRQNLITENILAVSRKVNEAQAERVAIESLFEQVSALRDRSGPTASVSLLAPRERERVDDLIAERLAAEREFATARVDYLVRHPKYQRAQVRLELAERRLRETSEELLATLEARLAAARRVETKLVRSLERHRKRALSLASLEPEFRQLQREVQSANDTFMLLERRDAEIGVSNRVEHSPVEILDRATAPRSPERLFRYLVVAAGCLCGFALGIGLAIAVDTRDRRVHGRGDLERSVAEYGLSVLGELPQLSSDPRLGVANMRAQRRQRDLHAHLFPQSMMAERCRSIRAAVSFALPSHRSVAVLVTSPCSAEGKSSTAMNLALSYCQSGRSVVLVDADMRRPRLHQVFPPPLEREELGLSTVIRGTSELDDALLTQLRDAPEKLTVLPCGEIPENPAELLESAAARRVFGQLRERFDVIVVDSPPLLPVVDPLILSPIVDGVVLVARSEATTHEDLHAAIGQLRTRDTYVVGVVLNEVDGRGGTGRYGSGYYTYESHKRADEAGATAKTSPEAAVDSRSS